MTIAHPSSPLGDPVRVLHGPRPLSPAAVPVLLGVFASLLIAASVGQNLLHEVWPATRAHTVWLLDVDWEYNYFAWFSSALLLGVGVQLFEIFDRARLAGDRFAPHWLVLSFSFLAISADEFIGLHEKASTWLQQHLHTHGAFYPAWAAVAIAICAAGAFAYRGFLAALPASTCRLMLISAAIYVGGAAGLEMIAGPFLETDHALTIPFYWVLPTLEESGEAAGAILFLYTLALYRRGRV